MLAIENRAQNYKGTHLINRFILEISMTVLLVNFVKSCYEMALKSGRDSCLSSSTHSMHCIEVSDGVDCGLAMAIAMMMDRTRLKIDYKLSVSIPFWAVNNGSRRWFTLYISIWNCTQYVWGCLFAAYDRKMHTKCDMAAIGSFTKRKCCKGNLTGFTRAKLSGRKSAKVPAQVSIGLRTIRLA